MTLDPSSYTNIVELLYQRASLHPERRALVFLGDGENATTEYSYAELHLRACAVAAQIGERAAPGDRALLIYPSGPAYVTAFLGCLYAGVSAVPAYPPASKEAWHWARLVSIVRDAEPRLILTERALLAAIGSARSALPELASVACMATDGVEPALGESLARGRPNPEDVALLQYTSGSTASPKGVMVSHQNLMAGERAISAAFSMNAEDVVVSWLPLFHDMGLIGTLLQPLYYGISGVLMSPQHFMERPERWLSAVSRFRGTVSGGPDFAYRLCAQRVDVEANPTLDLSSWRLAFCGAEPIRAETLSAFAGKLAPRGFDARALYPCYGLAESTLLVTGGRRGEGVHRASVDARSLRDGHVVASEAGQTLVCCGGAQAEHEVVVASLDDGEPLAQGRVGEVCVAGPSVALGYWNNPEGTAASFVGRRGRTWLRTGDLGFMHEGQLVVTGRHKDLIIVRGHNIYPQDIERSLEDRLDVLRKGRTVAFGLELGGEESIVVAVEVNPRVQKLIDSQALGQRISESVALLHGEPARLVLLLDPGGVPITSSGKLMRSACRSAWLKGKLDTFAVYELPAGTRPASEDA